MSTDLVKCSVTISCEDNTSFHLSLSGEVDHGKLQNEIQRMIHLFHSDNSLKDKASLSVPSDNSPKDKSHNPNTSKVVYGERNGTDYTVKSDIVITSFEDFAHEIEPGVVRVVCRNQPIKLWKGIEKFPHSVTQLLVEGCEIENFEGEIGETNIMEIQIDSCRLTSFKGIDKTKLLNITCSNNPCYQEWISLFSECGNSIPLRLRTLKEKYAKMQ